MNPISDDGSVAIFGSYSMLYGVIDPSSRGASSSTFIPRVPPPLSRTPPLSPCRTACARSVKLLVKPME